MGLAIDGTNGRTDGHTDGHTDGWRSTCTISLCLLRVAFVVVFVAVVVAVSCDVMPRILPAAVAAATMRQKPKRRQLSLIFFGCRTANYSLHFWLPVPRYPVYLPHMWGMLDQARQAVPAHALIS